MDSTKTVRLWLNKEDFEAIKDLTTLSSYATLATAGLMNATKPLMGRTWQAYNFDKQFCKMRHVRLPNVLCNRLPNKLKVQIGESTSSLSEIDITLTDFLNLAVRNALDNGLSVTLKGVNDAK